MSVAESRATLTEQVEEAYRRHEIFVERFEDAQLTAKALEVEVLRAAAEVNRACLRLLASEGKSHERYWVKRDGAGVRVEERPAKGGPA
jgi:hypothetical protein